MTSYSEQNTNCEGAILFDLKRFSLDDGPGPRTVLFFQGCPLDCPWCHNPEGKPLAPPLHYRKQRCINCGRCQGVCPLGLNPKVRPGKCNNCGHCATVCAPGALELKGRLWPFAEIFTLLARDRDLFRNGQGGVTASGGESLLQLESLVKIFSWCQKQGIHTLLETSGHGAKNVGPLLTVTNQVYLDLKFPDCEGYRSLGGSLEQVAFFAGAVVQAKVPLTIRVPIIPGYNDSLTALTKMASLATAWGASEFVLLPYHPWGRDKYRALGLPYTAATTAVSREELQAFQTGLKAQGFKATI